MMLDTPVKKKQQKEDQCLSDNTRIKLFSDLLDACQLQTTGRRCINIHPG